MNDNLKDGLQVAAIVIITVAAFLGLMIVMVPPEPTTTPVNVKMEAKK